MTQEIGFEKRGSVALVELRRPPHNFFDEALIRGVADIYDEIDATADLRAIVLAAQGKSFCAGGRFSADERSESEALGDVNELYRHASRMAGVQTPVIAAIQGAAVGGGLGVALTADMRIASPEARFWANFAKLGISPGFGLTFTLPDLIGRQKAGVLFMTARRLKAEEALAWGLIDALVPSGDLREAAFGLAEEIAGNAPLAVRATRRESRRGFAESLAQAAEREWKAQRPLFQTQDHKEGVSAMAERRQARFEGR